MNQTTPEKPSPILLLAPLAFVLIGYQYVFNASQSSELSRLQRQAQTLAGKERGIHVQERKLHSDLIAARQEMTALNTESSQLDTEQQELHERRVALRGIALAVHETKSQPSSSSTGPAGTMQSVCSLLRTHDLSLHQSSTPQKKTDGASDREQRELAKLLEVPRAKSQVYRLTLQGRFVDLQSALHELRSELPGVRLIAISLETAPPSETLRTWILDLAVG